MVDTSKVTRIEVIGEEGRLAVLCNRKNVMLSLQDDGRTLKVLCVKVLCGKSEVSEEQYFAEIAKLARGFD